MLNSPTASTLGKGKVAAGFDFRYVNFDEFDPILGHELHHDGREIHGYRHAESYQWTLGYGVLEDVDLFLSAPLVSVSSNQIEVHRDAGRNERSTGFGDMRLSGKYRFWKKGVEAALLAGLKFPTGVSAVKDKAGNKFAPELQPGSHSWDADFGIAFSRSFRSRISAATSFEYVLRTRGGQGFNGGDVFRYSAGGAVSLRRFGKYPNASAHLELNNEWALKDHERSGVNRDSGGTTISLTPGLSFSITPAVSAYAAMPLPVYQNLGGLHEETYFQVLAGMSVTV